MQKLLNTKEVAEILGVSVQTLTDWRCNKAVDIPYVKIGTSVRSPVRYRREDVEAFIASSVHTA